MELIEITCPYGRITPERNTMEDAFEFKMNKYQKLAEEIEEKTGTKVKVIPVIVSSMGAVYAKTMTMLKKLLKCEDKKLKKIGRKISEAAMIGSFDVWRKYIAKRERPVRGNEEVELITEEERKMRSKKSQTEKWKKWLGNQQ
jgi:hypothetical protein